MIRTINPLNTILNQSVFGKRTSGGLLTMKSDKFKTPYLNFNLNKSRLELTKKYSRYPFVIKGVVFLVSEYISGLSDTQVFTQQYLDRTPVLLQRIEYSKDKKLFEETYSKEIEIIKSLNKVCDKYSKGEMDKSDLDASVINHVKDFITVKPTEKHIFSA